jgi:hypothetical protein
MSEPIRWAQNALDIRPTGNGPVKSAHYVERGTFTNRRIAF